jgi:ribosomal-protein-alanine N-acetyltransferase
VNLHLENVTEKHLPDLVEFEKQVFGLEAYDTEDFSDAFRYKNTAVFRVAYDSGKLAGYVLGTHTKRGCKVDSLGVLPTYRGGELAKFLMDDFVRTVRPFCKSIFLEVRTSNMRARNFYYHLGFKTMKFREGYYDEPGLPKEAAIIMKLDL